MQDFDVLCLEGIFLLCIPLGISRQDISSSVSLVLTIVDSKVIMRELLGPADLSGAHILHVHEPTEIVMVGEYEHLMLEAF